MAKKWKGLTAGALVMALTSQGWAAASAAQTAAVAPAATPSGTQAPANAPAAPKPAPPPGAVKWTPPSPGELGKLPPVTLPNGGKVDPALSKARGVISDRLAQLTQHRQAELKTRYGGGEENDNAGHEDLKPDTIVRAIVQLSQPSAAKQAAAAGTRLASANSATLKQWQGSAVTQQAAVKSAIRSAGLNVTYRHTYTTALNGFSVEIPYRDLAKLSAVPGVTKVSLAKKYTLNDATSNELIGAIKTWGTDTAPGVTGAGKVIAIIDTGVDWRHPDLGGSIGEKVIGGYNFADHTDDFINRQGSQHGTHVAGIAAAKASTQSTGHLNGVAPGAKILAQKVFSNDEANENAFTDDLVAAIDDAVDIRSPHHEGVVAQVINMSLGAAAGFTDPDDPEQVAVADATAAGTVVAISAGNSSYSTADYGNPFFRNQDIAAIGVPGISASAIAVASSQNGIVTLHAPHAAVTAGGSAVHGSSIGTNDYNDWYEAAEGGPTMYAKFGSTPQTIYVLPMDPSTQRELGCHAADFADPEIANKIVLINRGVCPFQDKVNNAQNAGAAGVLVVDNKPDPDLIAMTTKGNKIPAAMIMKSLGDNIRAATGDLEVTFSNTFRDMLMEDPTVNTISSFSSWGTSPDLKLRPDVTAPGGHIFSTLNNGLYGSMDGTSMAAPHVAGASAVLLEARPTLSPAMVKTTFQNTAKILIDPNSAGLPFSPRQQGAGLIQLDKAVETAVTITSEDNTGAVSLGEVTGTKSFVLTLTNTGATPVIYNLDTSTILAPMPVTDPDTGLVFNSLSDEILTGATLTFRANSSTSGAALASVTVPKKSGQTNGTVKIYGTLNVTNATQNRFVEGFVKLTPSASTPGAALNVPFLGYMGNWKSDVTNLPIIDPAPNDPTSYSWMTGLYVLQGTKRFQLGWVCVPGTPCDPKQDDNWVYDPTSVALNPYSLGGGERLAAGATFLRNAKQAVIEVQDKSGKTVARLGNERNIRNITIAPALFGWDQEWAWNGRTYDRTTGDPYAVPADGSYKVVYKTLAGNGDPAKASDWQVYSLPLTLDSTGPEVTMSTTPSVDPTKPTTITWDATDAASGVAGSMLVVDGDYVTDPDTGDALLFPPGPNSYNVTLPEGEHYAWVETVDNAMNTGYSDMIEWDTIPLRTAERTAAINGQAGIEYSTNALVSKVEVYLDDQLDQTITFDEEHPAAGRHTYSKSGLTSEAVLTATFKAYYADAAEPAAVSGPIKIYVDGTLPAVSLLEPKVSDDPRPTVNSRWIRVIGNSTDNQMLSSITVNGQGIDDCIDSSDCSDTSLTWFADLYAPREGKNVLQVVTTDMAGNSITAARTVYVDSEPPIITSNVDDATNPFGPATKRVGDSMLDKGVFHLKGTAVSLGTGYTVSVNGEPLFSAEYAEDSMGRVVPREWAYDVPLSKDTPHQTVVIDVVSNGGQRATKVVNLEYASFMSITTDAPNGQWSPKVKPTLKVQVDLQAAAMLTVEVREASEGSGDAAGLFPPFPFPFPSGSPAIGQIFQGQGKKGANPFTWNGTLGGNKLPDGRYVLVARADGTQDEVSTIVTIRSEGPTLEVYGDTNRIQSAPEVSIDGVSEAAQVTVSGGNLRTPSVLKTDRLGRFFFKTNLTTDGNFTFTVTAKDALGNATAKNVQVVFKKTPVPPSVPTVTKPTANGIIKNATVPFAGTVTQADVKEVTVKVLHNDKPVGEQTVPVAKKQFSGSITLNDGDGKYKLVFTATDTFNFTSTGRIIETTLDTTAPVANFQGAPASTAEITMNGTSGTATGTQNTAFTVAFKLTEANLNTVKAKINGSNATVIGPNSNGIYTVKANSLKAGANRFEITVTDKAGFTVTYTVTVTGTAATAAPTTPAAPTAPTTPTAPTAPTTPTAPKTPTPKTPTLPGRKPPVYKP